MSDGSTKSHLNDIYQQDTHIHADILHKNITRSMLSNHITISGGYHGFKL